jgi:hypothetical protein
MGAGEYVGSADVVDAEAGVVVSLLPFFSKLIRMGEAINL